MTARACRVCSALEPIDSPFVEGLCSVCNREVDRQFMHRLTARTQRHAAHGGLSVLSVIGVLAMLAGGFGVYQALQLDTFVDAGPELGGDRIHNLALARQQTTYIVVSIAVFGAGLGMSLFRKR